MAYEGKGGSRAPGPPYAWPLWGGRSFNITSSSGNLHSTLHCILSICTRSPNTKRLRKELKYMLIHNIPFKALSDALKTHVSHFENWIFLFVVSLQKWLAHFLLQKRWRNEGFKGTSDMGHSIMEGHLKLRMYSI